VVGVDGVTATGVTATGGRAARHCGVGCISVHAGDSVPVVPQGPRSTCRELPGAGGNMGSSVLLRSKDFEAYVTVLAGEGDGTLITIDARGHIHVIPDPRPGIDEALADELHAAATEIAGGARAFAAAIGRISADERVS
jgi:hypothetical protein